MERGGRGHELREHGAHENAQDWRIPRRLGNRGLASTFGGILAAIPCRPYTMNQQNLADFIWSVADAVRGDFKQSALASVVVISSVNGLIDGRTRTAEADIAVLLGEVTA